MKTFPPLRKIALTLLIIVLLPALFYSIYELKSLNENEKMIGEIYRQQLETILFSINQYSWDVADSWVSRIDAALRESPGEALQNRLEGFVANNRAVQAVFLADSAMASLRFFVLPESNPESRQLPEDLRSALQNQKNLPEQLKRYRQAGYRKIEPVVVTTARNPDHQSVALLFALGDFAKDLPFRIAGLVLEPNNFINQVLAPKLEEVAGEQFYLAVYHGEERQAIYPAGGEVSGDAEQTKLLWLFPRFSLGIYPRGETIAELARSRSRWNLAFILLLDALLIAGVWFVYRNVRREVDLAQMKSDFVSNISHELRTPLSLIRMFSETLEMGRVRSEEKKQEYYKIIGQETERLTHLVNNILNFSRIEAGRKEYHFSNVNLNEIARKVLDNYQFHLKNEGFALETDFDSALPTVKADAEAVSESLINLLDNAVKYSDKEKYVCIRTGREDGAVYVEVEDHGIGIAVEHRQKIFEKFYRVSGALVHNTKGSGLGLSLVKHIMDAHQGRVVLESQPGKGSRFRLVFRSV